MERAASNGSDSYVSPFAVPANVETGEQRRGGGTHRGEEVRVRSGGSGGWIDTRSFNYFFRCCIFPMPLEDSVVGGARVEPRSLASEGMSAGMSAAREHRAAVKLSSLPFLCNEMGISGARGLSRIPAATWHPLRHAARLQYCGENIAFLHAIATQDSTFDEMSVDERRSALQTIYGTYIAEGLPTSLNLSDMARGAIHEAICRGNAAPGLEVFDGACAEVRQMLMGQ